MDTKRSENTINYTCSLCRQVGHNKQTCNVNLGSKRKGKGTDSNGLNGLQTVKKQKTRAITSMDTKLNEDTPYVNNLYDYNYYHLTEQLYHLNLPKVLESLVLSYSHTGPQGLQEHQKNIHFRQDKKQIPITEADRHFIFEVEFKDGIPIQGIKIQIPLELMRPGIRYRVNWGDGIQEDNTPNHVYKRKWTYAKLRERIDSEYPDEDEEQRENMFATRSIGLRNEHTKFIVIVELFDLPTDDYKVRWQNAKGYKLEYDYITHIHMWGKHVSLPDGGYQFAGLKQLQTMTHIFIPDTGHITNMSFMFLDATSYNQPLPAAWDTSKVRNMSFMFSGASSYNQKLPDIWDTSEVTDMRDMFSNATAYNQPLPGTWNTSKVTDMSCMFSSAIAYNQPLPDRWITTEVIDIGYMLWGAINFNHYPLPNNFIR